MSESVPLSRQVACAKRTVELERKRMDRLTRENKPFNRFAWEAEIKNMEAIVATLEKCQMLKEAGDELIAMSVGPRADSPTEGRTE